MTDSINAKLDYGLVGNNIADDTVALQAWINDNSGLKSYLPPGQYRHTQPLRPNPNGTDLYGVGGNGRFTSILRPENCRAFDFDGYHHTRIRDVMIWPQGNTPPDTYLYFANGYSNRLENIRIHLAANQAPCLTSAVLCGPDNNNLVFENLMVRSDGSYYPCAIKWLPQCGTVNLIGPDIETSGVGLWWEGGMVTVSMPYMERLGVSGLRANPSPADLHASLSIHGGLLTADQSGIPLQCFGAIRNLSLFGVHVQSDLSTYEGFRYAGGSWHNSALYGCRCTLAKWNFQPTVQ